MFQFPGFALKTLCIQVISTWFTPLLSSPKANNNRISSGLPHSEIAGSKPILGSPTLIAEYHVLHRLLLPRHPPNALLALDLIQKKQDLGSLTSVPPDPCRSAASEPKVIHFPQPTLVQSGLHVVRSVDQTWLVYLTWTKLPAFSPKTGCRR